jgi:hypothetical protein
MKHLMAILLLLVLLSVRCNKSSNNTLSGDYCVCDINGRKWQAGCDDLFNHCLSAQWTNQKRSLVLACQNNSLQVVTVVLYDSIGLKNGTYVLNNNYNLNCGQYRDYNKSYHLAYNTDSVHTGTIAIKFDSLRARVSGAFSFKAIYDFSNETVNITNGQFSLPCLIE